MEAPRVPAARSWISRHWGDLGVAQGRYWHTFTLSSPAELPRTSLRHPEPRLDQSPNYQPRHQR